MGDQPAALDSIMAVAEGVIHENKDRNLVQRPPWNVVHPRHRVGERDPRKQGSKHRNGFHPVTKPPT